MVGSGNVSLQYLHNAPLFRNAEIVACADINPEASRERANAFGIRACSVDELMGDSAIDIVLNLTIPAAHFDTSMRALDAGKHVYTEKPLCFTLEQGRALVERAESKGLALGCAPDTFLGAAGRYVRRQMDAGVIGRPVLGTAFMMFAGPEHVHPNPYFHYQPGGGPLMDMGPYYLTMLVNLMGPVRRVQAITTRGHDVRYGVMEGPAQGKPMTVETETTILSLLEFHNGAVVTFGTSWDVIRHSNQPIELHGTKGSLRVPDPDTFGGIPALSLDRLSWQEVDTADQAFGKLNWPPENPDRANYRMLGLSDMAQSILDARKPRASGRLALHVLEVMHAIRKAGETGAAELVPGSVEQPEALSEEEVRNFLA
jgi:predicted dehydrogenase